LNAPSRTDSSANEIFRSRGAVDADSTTDP
jgi:hypothetical protein